MAEKSPRKRTPQNRKPEAVRREDGTFGPGNSANPGGLPQWRREFIEAFGQRCAPLAEKVLFNTLSGLNAKTGEPDEDVKLDHQLQAAAEVLKYVLPKPKQEIKVEGASGGSPLAGLTLEDLLAFGRGVKAAAAVPQPQAQKGGTL